MHDCDFNKQFDEKRCRTLLTHKKSVCGGVATLHYRDVNPSLNDVCAAPLPGMLTLWSMGGHQLSPEHVESINSVSHHVAFMLHSDVCPTAAQHPANCRPWWCVLRSTTVCF